jgi:hypothetical protein
MSESSLARFWPFNASKDVDDRSSPAMTNPGVRFERGGGDLVAKSRNLCYAFPFVELKCTSRAAEACDRGRFGASTQSKGTGENLRWSGCNPLKRLDSEK